MVLKQQDMKDSIYFEQKKTNVFCFKMYIFNFSIYQVLVPCGPENFWTPTAVYQTGVPLTIERLLKIAIFVFQ